MTQIGDIGVSATQVITPVGTFPLKGTQWIVTDQSRTTTKIPTVAIVLAVVFIWVCFLSLLFLLMKEEVTEGYVQVAVSNPELGLYHVASIRADGNQTYEYVTRQVNWARSIAAAL
ncbi:MAG: hypothetical protein NTV23_11820 [Propionibacteriales bacterium]|nr:hypothetical protein [Propionibacteriales bacterium]